MSDSAQAQTTKDAAGNGSAKAKAEKEPRQLQTFSTLGADFTGPTPDESLTDGPADGWDSATSSVLSREPSTLLLRRSSPGRTDGAGTAKPSAVVPTFGGRNFCNIPTHASARPAVQPKLTVGAAHDPYEQEADDVAEQVMRMPAPVSAPPAGADAPEPGVNPIQRTPEEEEEIQAKPLVATIRPFVQQPSPLSGEPLSVRRRGAGGEAEDDLQTKRVSAADSFDAGRDFENRLSATRSGGNPLPAETRTFMEPRFGGMDFSGVRLHSGGEAAELNRSVSARAFTLGRDIYLGEGQTDVASDGGKRLLAHELTHVVQQTGAAIQRLPQPAAPDTPLVAVGAGALQAKGAARGNSQEAPMEQRPNQTGLPDGLKSGIESLSGMSLDNVKVHYNSSQPAQLNALAYAKGTDIHVAPGQEQHLPHEAWHVVQQAEGRVTPTMQMKGGVPVNDDAGLEHEADVMGAQAMSMPDCSAPAPGEVPFFPSSSPVQRAITLADADAGIYERDDIVDGEEYYYTGKGTEEEERPIYTPRIPIDNFEEEIEEAETNYENEQKKPPEEQITRLILSEDRVKDIKLYTDKNGLTDVPYQGYLKLNAIKMALSHPLLKDPNHVRGLACRFAEPNGVLFSRLSKEEAEKELGYKKIPDTVTFYHVLEIDWQREVEKIGPSGQKPATSSLMGGMPICAG
jgi:hypothetical protein